MAKKQTISLAQFTTPDPIPTAPKAAESGDKGTSWTVLYRAGGPGFVAFLNRFSGMVRNRFGKTAVRHADSGLAAEVKRSPDGRVILGLHRVTKPQTAGTDAWSPCTPFNSILTLEWNAEAPETLHRAGEILQAFSGDVKAFLNK